MTDELNTLEEVPEPLGLRYLKANEDISAVGAVITGGAATYNQAVLMAGDGLGVQLSAGGSFVVGFDSSVIPGGAFIKLFDIQAAASSPYADNIIDCYRDVALSREPVNPNAAYIQVGTTDDNGNWMFDQADVDTVQVVVSAPAGPPAVQVNVDQVSIAMDFVSEPTTNITPIPDTVDPFITVNWTHVVAGSDNYDGLSSHVKVFTEAQYTDPGFDSATSVAYFDSGVIPYVPYPGTNTMAVDILVSGDYRVYVSTSQQILDGRATEWFGPAGYEHWSGWGYFRGFTSTVPVTAKNLSYWNGTAWADGPVKYWDGAAYVDAAAVKYWDGAAWVDSVN